ncbi:ATP-grasp domain-containing protein [Candidatus Thorarchaeota archaeon]|nr:MAG: ATP-grasp domain-containing protein [Candidatus Thorarchaeota archaeon]
MTTPSSLLHGKNVGVIGFNARPIAASLKKEGARTYVSDYWGDLDLPDVSDECITVLTPVMGMRQRQPLDLPVYQSLIDNFLFLTEKVELDYVIIGSGFDDHIEALQPIYDSGLLIGSHTSHFKKARDLSIVTSMVSEEQCKIPQRQEFHSFQELVEKSTEISYPYLIRPLYSGGGSGIRFIRHQKDLLRLVKARQEENEETAQVVQEYIRGQDFSCSVLSTGNDALAVSVQAQLIGSPAAGRNCDFAYCGNFIPSGLDSQTEQKIMEISEHLSVQLGLQGSIGLDFVVDELSTIWLMEINPRIQGTLEMLEIAGNISITEQHVRAVHQDLIEEIPIFHPTVKMIVYSRRNGKVPDLSLFSNTFDRSPTGVFVNRRDPICTVINQGTNIQECYHTTCSIANSIQREVRPVYPQS